MGMVWEHAGSLVTSEHSEYEVRNGGKEPVTVAGEKYWVCHGYYVPYYPIGPEMDEDEQEISRHKLAIDLTKRFFRNAELGINVRFSYKEVLALRKRYASADKESEERRALGALLVGAIVNRIERLSHAILQEKQLESVLEDYPHDDADTLRTHVKSSFIESSLEQETDAPNYRQQLSDLQHTLMIDDTLVGAVRRRDRARDRDAILPEMISELIKPVSYSLRMTSRGRALKIGEAMEAMDEANHALQQLVEASCDAIDIPTELAQLIEAFTMSAKRRAGIKTDDADGYVDAEVAYKAAENAVHEIIHPIIQEARSTQMAHVLDVYRIIRRGVALIDDMAEIRNPRNQMAFLEGEERETLISSVSQLQKDSEECIAYYK